MTKYYLNMIEVTVKTLKNVATKINIDENSPFETQLELFKEASELTTEAYIKLIHTGKVLEQNKTPSSYGIAQGDAIIVMKGKAPAPPKPVAVAAPEPAPAPVAVPAPNQTNTTSQSVSSGLTNQSQPPAQIPQADIIWTSPSAEDTTATYSVEQAHVILPMVFSYIMQNPNLRLLMMTNPSILNEVMVGANFRSIVRQLLAQSPSLLNAIRTGTPANIYIGTAQGGSTGTTGSTGTAMTNTEQGTPQLTMEQLTQAMSMLGANPSDFMDDNYDDYTDDAYEGHDHSHECHEGHDHSHSHSHAHTQSQNSAGLTSADQQNIAQLMEITGAQFQVARQAYESSNKNMEMAGSLLMQIMFS